MSNEINLLKASTSDASSIFPYQNEIRKLSLLILVIVLAFAIILLVVNSLMAVSKNAHLQNQQNLTKQLEFEKTKEHTLLVIKNRISIVEKALDLRKPIGEMVTIATDIAPYPKLKTIEYDEQKIMQLKIEPESLEEVMEMLSKMLYYVKQGNISDPMIKYVTLDKKGFSLALSFVPEYK